MYILRIRAPRASSRHRRRAALRRAALVSSRLVERVIRTAGISDEHGRVCCRQTYGYMSCRRRHSTVNVRVSLTNGMPHLS